jgi:hypothetical protein
MSGNENGPLTSILPQTDFREDMRALPIDRQARHLSRPGTQSVPEITAAHLRQYLLDPGEHRNLGGVHASYRAVKAFLRWYEEEHEPSGWQNPIVKARPPKRPRELLTPAGLADVPKLLATCEAGT